LKLTLRTGESVSLLRVGKDLVVALGKTSIFTTDNRFVPEHRHELLLGQLVQAST
jgi:hypothetical protein